jgi:hypothetical protein
VDAWYLDADSPREALHAVRPLRRSQELEWEELRWLDEMRVCVPLEVPPSTKLRQRVERRLGRPVEVRLDCEVAWYPLGRGYVVLTVQPPAEALPTALDELSPAFSEIVFPADPQAPVRVCLPKMAVADPLALAEALEAQGIGILAVYEVGGCRR